MSSSRDHLLRLLDLHAAADPFFFPASSSSSSCPFFSSLPPSIDLLTSSASACPLGLDLFLPAAAPFPPLVAADPFALDTLSHRVSALERALAPPPPPRPRRKYTYAAEADGRKVKWTAEDKPSGGRNLKWEAEISTPLDDGFDRKWKWESKASPAGATTKVKWTKEIKGKGCLHPWSNTYSVEESYDHGDDAKKKNKKEAHKTVRIVEVDDNTAACHAIRKAFERASHGKRKDRLSPQDAALLIQINYRAHLAHRSQVLRCLRDLAVAKAKLKEIRSLFYSISYRRRVARDSQERQRFADKIIVLLLTVDEIQGPDYMVRNAKRFMLEELEGMLEILDPQPPGKLSHRKFDLRA